MDIDTSFIFYHTKSWAMRPVISGQAGIAERFSSFHCPVYVIRHVTWKIQLQ